MLVLPTERDCSEINNFDLVHLKHAVMYLILSTVNASTAVFHCILVTFGDTVFGIEMLFMYC